MSAEKPTMHCQEALEKDLGYDGFIPDALIQKWFEDRYSTSKHLWTLYSMARGLEAKTIVEIGFGRSTFVLARAAFENKGQFYSCDTRDFSYLLNAEEKAATTFHLGTSEQLFSGMSGGAEMILLDYLGDRPSPQFCKAQITMAMEHMMQNGLLVIHDAFNDGFTLPGVLKDMFGSFSGSLLRRGYQLSVLPYNYGLAIIRRTSSSKHGVLLDKFEKKTE